MRLAGFEPEAQNEQLNTDHHRLITADHYGKVIIDVSQVVLQEKVFEFLCAKMKKPYIGTIQDTFQSQQIY